MATTISVSEETRKRLMQLKLDEGARSVDALPDAIIVDPRKMRLLEASALFRERLKDSGTRFEDLAA